MIFKGSFTILAAVAAVVSTVNGAALGLEKRASTATCTLVALPSRAVPATVNLGARWNFVLGRRLQLFLGGKAISNNAEAITGPDAATGTYTVVEAFEADVSESELTNTVVGWTGATVSFDGIDWIFQTITC